MPKSRAPGKLMSKSQKSVEVEGKKSRQPTPKEEENLRLKVEVARALGLWEKVEAHGWGALTAAESGRIGGWMTRMRFQSERREDTSERSPNA